MEWERSVGEERGGAACALLPLLAMPVRWARSVGGRRSPESAGGKRVSQPASSTQHASSNTTDSTNVIKRAVSSQEPHTRRWW